MAGAPHHTVMTTASGHRDDRRLRRDDRHRTAGHRRNDHGARLSARAEVERRVSPCRRGTLSGSELMIAARLHAVGDLRVAAEPDRAQPPQGWSLLAVTSVGICGSDLHWFTDGGIGENRIERPVVPGHEFAAVAITGPYAGRRVAVDPAIPCGSCEMCRLGHHNLCPTVRFAGHGDAGRGTAGVPAVAGSPAAPVARRTQRRRWRAARAARRGDPRGGVSHLRPGSDVLVVGAGPIGVLALQVAPPRGGAGFRHRTARAPQATRVAQRCAMPCGHPSMGRTQSLEATDGRGVDVVIELAGTDAAIATAVTAARPGGRVALGGIPSEDSSSFPAATARRKGLTFAMVRRMKDTYPRAIALALAGVDLDLLVTERHPLVEAAQGVRRGCGASRRQGRGRGVEQLSRGRLQT